MKIAFQNFLTTLKRYKTASVLNIAGLTIAFIAFYILMAQVHHGLSYNSSIPDYERVYVTVTEDYMSEFFSLGVPWSPTEETIKQIPEVEAAGYFSFFESNTEKYIYKKNGEHYNLFNLTTACISLSAIDALGIEMIVGDAEQLRRPQTVIISDYAAEKMKLGIGDFVYYYGVSKYDGVEIVGIYKAFQKNSMFSETNLLRLGYTVPSLFNKGQTGIIKLQEGADPEKFENLWRDIYAKKLKAEVGEGVLVKEKPMRLISLKDLYFSPFTITKEYISIGFRQGNLSTIYGLIAVAILTVLIAFINFVNFFFALIPVRIRAVNISKVFGATNRSLRWSFLFEALALTLISLALALYLMIAIQDSFIADFVDCSLALKDNIVTIGWILLIVVALALTAALYPAWYITSFAPSLAIKGRFGGSKAGQRLRMVLSFVQFSISMTLIMVTLAFWLQYRYMAKYDMGFNYDNVVTFGSRSREYINDSQFESHNNVILEELKRSPMVEDATMAQQDMFKPSLSMGLSATNDSEKINVDGIIVRYNFLQFFHIPVTGRDFSPTDNGKRIVTSELLNKLSESGHHVPLLESAIGFISGCRFRSVNRPDVYYEIMCNTKVDPMTQFYLRLHPKADYKQVVEQIRTVWDEVVGSGSDLLQIEKVEDQIADMYAETRKQTVLLSLFAFTSIIISLMGVFGIVIFETQYRRKEIAIRRVFGATTSGLLWMFNSRYVQIVGACFLLSVPVAYYIIHEWQKSFVYKAPIGWWVYVSALALVLLITLSLVTSRSLKAAHENPADVVKGE